MYVVEQVLMSWKVAVGGWWRQWLSAIACFEPARRGWREGWEGLVGQMRRRDPVRAGACGRFEIAVAGSCSVLVERGGAKQELSWSKPFDDMHGSAANRAVPE